eukprot:gene10102-21048_t
MYVIVFVCAVIFPIVYLKIDPTPAILLTVMAVGYVIATLGCVLLLFGPKTALLWIGADVDDSFAIVKRVEGVSATNGLVMLKEKISSKVSSYGSKAKESSANNVTKEYHVSHNESPGVSVKHSALKNAQNASAKSGKLGWTNGISIKSVREMVTSRVSEEGLPAQIESYNEVHTSRMMSEYNKDSKSDV